LRHPLGATESLVKRRRRNVCDEEQARMPEGSEFDTEGAATLKPREAKIWTIDNLK